MAVPSCDLDHGELGRVGARHERRREERQEAEKDRRGEHVVEPGGEDPPPRDEAEDRVILGELLEVVARRLSLVNHRSCGFAMSAQESEQEGIQEESTENQKN